MTTSRPFEVTSKRRKGFPSETNVNRGLRFVRGGEKELVEKLGRNDPCPCGSGKRFQAVLPHIGPVSTVPNGRIIGGEQLTGQVRLLDYGKAGNGMVFTAAVIHIHDDLDRGLARAIDGVSIYDMPVTCGAAAPEPFVVGGAAVGTAQSVEIAAFARRTGDAHGILQAAERS